VDKYLLSSPEAGNLREFKTEGSSVQLTGSCRWICTVIFCVCWCLLCGLLLLLFNIVSW